MACFHTSISCRTLPGNFLLLLLLLFTVPRKRVCGPIFGFKSYTSAAKRQILCSGRLSQTRNIRLERRRETRFRIIRGSCHRVHRQLDTAAAPPRLGGACEGAIELVPTAGLRAAAAKDSSLSSSLLFLLFLLHLFLLFLCGSLVQISLLSVQSLAMPRLSLLIWSQQIQLWLAVAFGLCVLSSLAASVCACVCVHMRACARVPPGP